MLNIHVDEKACDGLTEKEFVKNREKHDSSKWGFWSAFWIRNQSTSYVISSPSVRSGKCN